MARRSNPIHTLPFEEPIAHALADEYAEQPLGRRIQALRKAAFRELMMTANGQSRRRVERVPPETRALLWIYTWTTVGDAIMDLAPRTLIPPGVGIDLLIVPALAPLFAFDRRFRAVHTDPANLPANIDFVLLDSFRSHALRLKADRFGRVPFASMRGHHAGERFDRTAFADRRMRQLFGIAPGEVVSPRLDLGESDRAALDGSRFRIAIPLGARVPRNRYLHWRELLRRLVATWPAGMAKPEFRLLGQGGSAYADLEALGTHFVAAHCVPIVGRGDLRKIGFDIAECDAFLGVDGGLMHVAIGVGTPGLALFSHIDPAYRLRPGSAMQAMLSEGDVSDVEPNRLAAAFVAELPRLLSLRKAKVARAG